MDQQDHKHKNDKPEHGHQHDHHAHGHSEKPVDQKADDKVQAKADEQKADNAAKETQTDKETIVQLNEQVAALNDKYLRLMAEFENFKRRTAKEYQQLIEQANEKLMKEIIEVRESFERAFKTLQPGADPVPFIEGMKMIFTKLDAVLRKHGLEVYCEAGQEFDPQVHDAMMKTPHAEIPEHHIAEVVEKGYKLKGRVIKHSRVIVSSGKPGPAAADENKKDEETVFEVDVDPGAGAEQKEESDTASSCD